MTAILEVFLPAIVHIGLATFLTAAIFLTGLPLAQRLRFDGNNNAVIEIVLAYPIGVFFLVLLGLIDVLLVPGFGLGLLVCGVATSLILRSTKTILPVIWRTLFLSFPASLVYGLVAAAYHGGPTIHHAGGSYGDTIWYVARLETLAATGSLFAHPLVEGDRWLQHEILSQATGFVGTMLIRLPIADSFMYFAIVVPVIAIQSTAISLRALLPLSERRQKLAVLGSLLAFVSIGHYAGWEIESPPVAWSLVLAFSLAVLSAMDCRRWSWGVAVALILLIFSLTKTLGVIFAAAVLALPALRHLMWLTSIIGKSKTVALIIVVISVSASAGFVLFDVNALYGIYITLMVDHSLETFIASLQSPPGLYALGACLIAAIFLPLSVGLPVIFGVAAFFISPPSLYILPSLGFGYIAAYYLVRPSSVRHPQLSLPLAGIIGIVSFNVLSTDQLMFGAILATKGFAYAAVVSHALLPLQLSSTFVIRLASAVALVAAASVIVRGPYPNRPLSPEEMRLWQTVREVVPHNALVFTSFTGRNTLLDAGWNSYAATADRQFYIAGWYGSRIRFRPAELNARIAQNEAVLNGRIKPSNVSTEARYEAYYAVVHPNFTIPNGWKLIAQTEKGSVYRIE